MTGGRTHTRYPALPLLAALLAAAPSPTAADDLEETPADPAGEDGQDGAVEEEEAAFLAGPADEEPEPAGDVAPPDPEEKWGGKLRDHRHQGFVNVLAGTGFYLVAPYDKNDPDKACGYDDNNDSEPICTGRSGVHLDFLGGFGVTDGLEVFALFRLGVEHPDQSLPETRLIGAGVKVYSPADGLFKISFGVAPLFDFSERRVDKSYDFVIHVPIGLHFDIVPWFGAYLQVAPNISFITEFKMDITGGLGVQGRFP